MQIKKAVIAVAGFGTRFLPATKAVPKELFPIINIPILEILVKELSEAGIEQICMIISRGKESILKHFDRNVEVELNLKNKNKTLFDLATSQSKYAKINYMIQKEPLGFADAVSLSKDFVGNEPFVLCVGDEVFFGEKSLTTQLIECYERCGTPSIALCEVSPKETKLYGIADVDLESNVLSIKGLVEKPKQNPPSLFANIGKYIMTPEIFDCIERFRGTSEEINFIDCLNELSKIRGLNGVVGDGVRFDTGSKLGFVKANIYASLKDKDLKNDIKDFMKEIVKLDEV